MRKITFFTVVDGVADAFPVAHAREFKFDWVTAVKNSYKSKMEKNKHTRFNHLARCPGVFDLLNTGYIIPMPWDLTIETDGDMLNFAWHMPSKDIEDLFNTPLVTGHMPNGIAEHLPTRPFSLESIIKLNTPWHIISPPGLKFIMIPIAYPDSFEFENVIGILDPSISSEINLQLRWNVTNGIHTIKAGTPMVQLIPLIDEKFQLEVRNQTEKDKQWILKRRYLNNCTFFMNRPMISKIYHKFHNTINRVKEILKIFKLI
jgi:hypothetical protein